MGARVVRTTYWDDRDKRFVTIVWDRVSRALHYKHDRTVTDLAKAKRLGSKVALR
jgi:hypothetical protein